VAPAICAGMVKANAYGLGVSRVAPALYEAGCRHFFTANANGAMNVKRLLPDANVYVLNGLTQGTDKFFVEHDLKPVLNDLGQIEHWSKTARELGRRLPAIIHLDTGMARLGLPGDETEILAGKPELMAGIEVEFFASHLACADEHDHPLNGEQLHVFRKALAILPPAPASLANSSGIFLGPDYHFDLARPGYAVYGGNPTPGRPNPMQPVVRLQARIIQIREIKAGQPVGYGATYRAREPQRIATIPVGYADGYLRSLSGVGVARLAGREVPLVGRVSMDLVTLDVTAVPEVEACIGAWVDLIWGPDKLDRMAGYAGTIGYELLTALGGRYPRHYMGGPRS
jgi:alanine racemase